MMVAEIVLSLATAGLLVFAAMVDKKRGEEKEYNLLDNPRFVVFKES